MENENDGKVRKKPQSACVQNDRIGKPIREWEKSDLDEPTAGKAWRKIPSKKTDDDICPYVD